MVLVKGNRVDLEVNNTYRMHDIAHFFVLTFFAKSPLWQG